MITITEACRSLLHDDPIALQAISNDLLNLSSYAEKILPQVEEYTMKKVQKGTVVVALSRIAEEVKATVNIFPEVVLDDLSIKSPLCDITYVKTPKTREKLITLYQSIMLNENAYFTVTQSMTEITIIAPQNIYKEIIKHFGVKPKAVFNNLAGITVRFAQEYLEVPNVLYVLQSALATRQINFTEIISTYTEFSFIIEKQYLEAATKALQKFLK